MNDSSAISNFPKNIVLKFKDYQKLPEFRNLYAVENMFHIEAPYVSQDRYGDNLIRNSVVHDLCWRLVVFGEVELERFQS